MASSSKAVALVRSSINIDEVLAVPHIVRPGETLSSNGVDRKIGGKGANVSAAIALGRSAGSGSSSEAVGSVFLAGSIGQGDEWLLEELQARGVRTESVKVREDVKTGTAYIQVAEDGENSIILLKGANFASDATMDEPVWLFARVQEQAGGAPVTHMMLQNEIPLEVTKAMLAHAHGGASPSSSSKVTSIFNPSPMLTTEQVRSFPWGQLDVLIVNEGEGLDLLEAFDGESAKEVKSDDADSILKALAGTPQLEQLAWIIMTRGGKGVSSLLKKQAGGDYSLLHIPAGKPKSVVDTTGAGDTFAGYVVASLMALHEEQGKQGVESMTEEEARKVLATAAWAGALAVESNGAMVSIPKRDDVVRRQES